MYIQYFIEIPVDRCVIYMDQARAQFGWITYTVVDQRQDYKTVHTTAGQSTTAGTTRMSQLPVSSVGTSDISVEMFAIIIAESFVAFAIITTTVTAAQNSLCVAHSKICNCTKRLLLVQLSIGDTILLPMVPVIYSVTCYYIL